MHALMDRTLRRHFLTSSDGASIYRGIDAAKKDPQARKTTTKYYFPQLQPRGQKWPRFFNVVKNGAMRDVPRR